MSSCVEQISAKLSKFFVTDWWDNYKLAEPLQKNQYNTFLQDLSVLRGEAFNLLNASILLNEYAKFDIEDQLADVARFSRKISRPMTLGELDSLLLRDLDEDFIEFLNYSISIYGNFIKSVKDRFRQSYQQVSIIDIDLVDGELNIDRHKDLQILQINTHLATTDHFLTPENETYLRLNNHLNELSKKLSGYTFSILLRNKCLYLMYKWNIKKDNSTDDILKGSLVPTLFGDWIKYLNVANEKSTRWREEITDYYNDFKHKTYDFYTLKEIHCAIKYFKDVRSSYANLKKLRVYLQEKLDVAKLVGGESKIYVLSVAVNFAYNNEFSLLVDTPGADEEEVEKLYDEIIGVQIATGINNYFPQHKYIKYLSEKLQVQSSNHLAFSDLNNQRAIIDKCKAIITAYKNNVEWCERHYNFNYYLLYEECLIKTSTEGFSEISIFSSFELPVDRNDYLEPFRRFENEVLNREKSLEIFENVNEEFIELKKAYKEISELKASISEREIKSIEIIAIFTSVATFVLASVTNFKFINSGGQAALFTLCLGLSLTCFVLLIHTVIRKDDNTPKIVLSVLLIGLIGFVAASFWVLISYSDQIKRILELLSR